FQFHFPPRRSSGLRVQKSSRPCDRRGRARAGRRRRVWHPHPRHHKITSTDTASSASPKRRDRARGIVVVGSVTELSVLIFAPTFEDTVGDHTIEVKRSPEVRYVRKPGNGLGRERISAGISQLEEEVLSPAAHRRVVVKGTRVTPAGYH